MRRRTQHRPPDGECVVVAFSGMARGAGARVDLAGGSASECIGAECKREGAASMVAIFTAPE